MQTYQQIVEEMIQKYGAESVRLDYLDDSFNLICKGRPDLRISRNQVDDNLHHQMIKEWSNGQASST